MTDHFVYKLIPPRPTFAMDMTDEEQAVMGQHAGYWQELFSQGRVVVFGPVLDPDGTWGLAVVEAETAEDVETIGAADPAVTSGTCTFAVLPMAGGLFRG